MSSRLRVSSFFFSFFFLNEKSSGLLCDRDACERMTAEAAAAASITLSKCSSYFPSFNSGFYLASCSTRFGFHFFFAFYCLLSCVIVSARQLVVELVHRARR